MSASSLTNEDDTITLVIGESDLSFVAGTGAATTITLAGAESGAGNANIDAVNVNASTAVGEGSQEVTVSLGGGDDIVDLVLGSEQTEDVTLKFSRAGNDDHETIDVNTLEDLGAIAGVPGRQRPHHGPPGLCRRRSIVVPGRRPQRPWTSLARHRATSLSSTTLLSTTTTVTAISDGDTLVDPPMLPPPSQ